METMGLTLAAISCLVASIEQGKAVAHPGPPKLYIAKMLGVALGMDEYLVATLIGTAFVQSQKCVNGLPPRLQQVCFSESQLRG